MQKQDGYWLNMFIVIALAVMALIGLTGCEEYLNLSNEKDDESPEQIAGLIDGAVIIETGNNATIQKVDTVDDPVRIKTGDNANIGPINTGAAPESEE